MVRRLTILALGLLLAACGSGTNIGSELDYSATPSAKPSPSKTTKKPAPVKTTKKPPVTKQPGREPESQKVAATSGFQYDPSDFALRSGDKVIFTNTHPGQLHSFTVTGFPIDSGEIAAGESKTLVINLPPGNYQFSCSVVPYMVAGSMVIG